MGILFKVLVFTAGFLVVTFWIRSLFRVTRRDQNTPPDMYRPSSHSRGSKQTIASCKYCGLFIPESQIVRGRHGEYCSKEHRELDER